MAKSVLILWHQFEDNPISAGRLHLYKLKLQYFVVIAVPRLEIVSLKEMSCQEYLI